MSEAVETKPLTDAALKVIEGNATDCYDCGSVATDVERLVAEVRRLRSDEWLEKAAKAIAAETDNDGCLDAPDGERWTSNKVSILAHLRKHRDGKA